MLEPTSRTPLDDDFDLLLYPDDTAAIIGVAGSPYAGLFASLDRTDCSDTWWSPQELADATGEDVEEIVEAFSSPDVSARAGAYRTLVSLYPSCFT